MARETLTGTPGRLTVNQDAAAGDKPLCPTTRRHASGQEDIQPLSRGGRGNNQ